MNGGHEERVSLPEPNLFARVSGGDRGAGHDAHLPPLRYGLPIPRRSHHSGGETGGAPTNGVTADTPTVGPGPAGACRAETGRCPPGGTAGEGGPGPAANA